MFKSFRSLGVLALSVVFAGPVQADFPKELLDKHPCLKEVAQPWSDPLPASKMPTAFHDWDTVYVGYWKELDGSKVCSALLLSKVSDDGARVAAVYTNAPPYKREHNMWGRFMNVDGKKALRIEKGEWWVQYVMNDDGTLVMSISLSPKFGELYAASKADKVAVDK